MKAKYLQLLDKSLSASLSAIELYNKPNFSYREESFSILIVNAWELLLKAQRVKRNNGRLTSIYKIKSNKKKDGTPRKIPLYATNKVGFETVGIRWLLEKEVSDANLKIQIESIIEIRDNSIHFMNPTNLFEKEFVGLATASLKSYSSLLEEWFNKSINEYNISLIPITFTMPDIFNVEELTKSSSGHKKLIEYITKQKSKTSSSSEHDISLVIDVKLERFKDGISIKFDKDGAPVFLDSEETFKRKYPLDYNSLLSKLRARYSNLVINQAFHKTRKGIMESNDEIYGDRFLDYDRKSGSKKTYYSSNIIAKFDNFYTKK